MKFTGPFTSCIVLALLILFAAVHTVLGTEDANGSDNVAVVNGNPISNAEFEMEMSQTRQQLANSGRDIPEDRMDEFKNRVLDNMINQELLYQETQRRKVSVDDADVRISLQRLKEGFGGQEAYEQALEKTGMTESGLTNRIARGLAIKSLVDAEIEKEAAVTDADVKQYFDAHPDEFVQPEQVKASHILVKVTPDATEEDRNAARKKLADLKKRLQAGEAFEALATEHSDCPSKNAGGDLGYFGRGKMVKPFEDAAFGLKPGETSDIVETSFGYHLIKVTDKKEGGKLSFDAVRDQLYKFLKQQKKIEKLAALIDSLRSSATIER